MTGFGPQWAGTSKELFTIIVIIIIVIIIIIIIVLVTLNWSVLGYGCRNYQH